MYIALFRQYRKGYASTSRDGTDLETVKTETLSLWVTLSADLTGLVIRLWFVKLRRVDLNLSQFLDFFDNLGQAIITDEGDHDEAVVS